jgi:hypothetical protein
MSDLRSGFHKKDLAGNWRMAQRRDSHLVARRSRKEKDI